MGILVSTPTVIREKVTKKANEYGSVENRLSYAIKQNSNLRKSMLKADAVMLAGGAATAGATIAVAKSEQAQNLLKKGFEAAKNSNLGQKITTGAKELLQYVAPFAKKAVNFVKALPGPAKAVLAIGTTITALVIGNINNKSIRKQGEISQEYKDKAKLQKALS